MARTSSFTTRSIPRNNWPRKGVGWGHSSWLEGVKIAREGKVRNLILFHHDPDSTDKVIDGFLSAARHEFPATWAATEGMTVSLSERGIHVALPKSRVGQRRRIRFAATVSGQGEDGLNFEEKATVRDISLQGAYLTLEEPPEAAVGIARGD